MTDHATDVRQVVISTDGHAGAAVLDYRPYLDRRLHDAFDAWANNYHDAWAVIDADRDEGNRIGFASFDSSLNWDSARRLAYLRLRSPVRVRAQLSGRRSEEPAPRVCPPLRPPSWRSLTLRSPRRPAVVVPPGQDRCGCRRHEEPAGEARPTATHERHARPLGSKKRSARRAIRHSRIPSCSPCIPHILDHLGAEVKSAQKRLVGWAPAAAEAPRAVCSTPSAALNRLRFRHPSAIAPGAHRLHDWSRVTILVRAGLDDPAGVCHLQGYGHRIVAAK